MSRSLKKCTISLVLAAMLLGLMPADTASAAKKVSLSSKKMLVKVGQTKTIKVKNTKKKVKWSVSNKKVVSLSRKTKTSATIKGKKSGTAKITAKVGKKKYRCKITVKKDSDKVSVTETPEPSNVSSLLPESPAPSDNTASTTVSENDFVYQICEYEDSKWVSITDYTGNQKIVHIPEKIKGIPVLEIGETGFQNNDIIEEIYFPTGLNLVGTNGFNNCSNLKYVEFSTLDWLTFGCFKNCKKLTSVKLGNRTRKDKVLDIYNFSFSGCTSLEEIYIPDNCMIGNWCFEDCTKLNKVTFGGDNVEFSRETFGNTPWMTEQMKNVTDGMVIINHNLISGDGVEGDVIIPNDVYCISESAFAENEKITSVQITDSVKAIRIFSFQRCRNLKSVTMTDSVKELGAAFGGCSSLSSVRLSDNITSLLGAFNGCTSLKRLTLPLGIQKLWGTFESCGIEEITLPNTLTEIGTYTFEDTDSLKELVIPSSVSVMEKYTILWCDSLERIVFEENSELKEIPGINFNNCDALKEIILPQNLEKIGDECFCRNKELKTLYIPPSVKEIGESCFISSNNLCLLVESGSYAEQYAIENDINYSTI